MQVHTLFNKDITIYYPLKCNGVYETFPYSYVGAFGSYSNAEDSFNFLKDSFLTEEECDKRCDELNKSK